MKRLDKIRRAAAATFVTFVAMAGLTPRTAVAQTAQAPAADAAQPGLSLQGSVGAGFDTNALLNTSSTNSTGSSSTSSTGSSTTTSQVPIFQGRNTHLAGDARLSYSVANSRIGFGASAGSTFQVYQTTTAGQLFPIGHAAGFGLSAGLSPHVTAQFGAAASYSPRYQFDVLPSTSVAALGQTTPPPLEYGLAVNDVLNYSGNGGLSYRPSQHSSFGFDYRFERVNFSGSSLDGTRHTVGGTYHRNITKYLGLRLGYSYQQADYGASGNGGTASGSQAYTGHNIDVGVDYSRSLTLTPGTAVAFRFGSAVIGNGQGRYYRITGNANVGHQFFRTWNLNFAYDRGMNFVSGFAAPVFSDSLILRIGGPLSKRVSAQTTGGFSKGAVGFSQTNSDYSSYRGTARLQGLVAQQLSAYVEYFYFHNDFDESVLLLQGLTPRLSRQGLRVGLTWNFDVPLTGDKTRRRRRNP